MPRAQRLVALLLKPLDPKRTAHCLRPQNSVDRAAPPGPRHPPRAAPTPAAHLTRGQPTTRRGPQSGSPRYVFLNPFGPKTSSSAPSGSARDRLRSQFGHGTWLIASRALPPPCCRRIAAACPSTCVRTYASNPGVPFGMLAAGPARPLIRSTCRPPTSSAPCVFPPAYGGTRWARSSKAFGASPAPERDVDDRGAPAPPCSANRASMRGLAAGVVLTVGES